VSAPCPEYGFIVTMELASSLTERERDRLRDAWEDLLASRGLVSEGHVDDEEWWELPVLSEASQATDADREAVRAWLDRRGDLRSWDVGELIDLRDMD